MEQRTTEHKAQRWLHTLYSAIIYYRHLKYNQVFSGFKSVSSIVIRSKDFLLFWSVFSEWKQWLKWQYILTEYFWHLHTSCHKIVVRTEWLQTNWRQCSSDLHLEKIIVVEKETTSTERCIYVHVYSQWSKNNCRGIAFSLANVEKSINTKCSFSINVSSSLVLCCVYRHWTQLIKIRQLWLHVISCTHTHTHSAPSSKLLFGVAEENQTSLTGSKGPFLWLK